MQSHGWQYQKKVSVAGGGGTTTVTLPRAHPILERLTVWASSGGRVLSNMTFQVRINGKSFGASANVTGAAAADIVLAMNGATRDQIVFPWPKGGISGTDVDPSADGFEIDVLLTNAGGGAESVTVYFVAVGHDGGMR